MSLPSSHTALAHRLVQVLSLAETPSKATEGVLREVAAALGAAVGVLWVLDESAQQLQWSSDWAEGPELEEFRTACRRLSFVEGVGLPGRVLATQDCAWMDAGSEVDFPRASLAAAAGLRSGIACLVSAPDGDRGVMEFFCRELREPRPEDFEEIRLAGRQLGAYLGRLRTEDRLRASEETSASIMRAALDCIIVMDHEGLVTDFNPAAEATFGHTRDEAVGRRLAELIIPPAYREAHRRALDNYLSTGEGPILGKRLELEALRSDGSEFPVELTVTRLGSQEPPVFAGFIRDLTHRAQAESERNRLLREAISSRALAEAAQQRSSAARAAAEAARRDAELAGMRLALLAQAGERMLAARDYEETMQQVTDLAVPAVADWCSVTVVVPGGGLRTVAATHDEPAKRSLLRELIESYPVDPEASAGAPVVIRSGRTEVVERVDEDLLRRLARDDRHLELLEGLETRTVITVPLRSQRRVLGAMTLALAGSGRTFTAADVSLAESLAARAGLAIDNARLLRERSHIADTLQRSLLPASIPPVPGFDVAARYRAAGEQNLVGGDFYDFFKSADGAWTAILGDVSGKGAEAAAVTALSRHTLRAGALREGSPRANLRLLNEALLNSREQLGARFATVVYVRLSPDEDGATLTVSTGGHMPPLIVRAGGELEYVELRGTLLGAVEQVQLVDLDVHLRRGDLMLLYTDGVTEVKPDDPGFGERLLERTLREHAGAPAGAVLAALERAVVEAQDGEPRDDVALIAVRALGARESVTS